MKKTALFSLLACALVLAACAGGEPPTATAPEETAISLGGPDSAEVIEEPEYAGMEESVSFFAEEGALTVPGTRQVAALSSAGDLEPCAPYFSEADLAAARALIEKDGPTYLVELFVSDPICDYSLSSVRAEADHVLVQFEMNSPLDEAAEEAVPHGLHFFLVFHLPAKIAGGLPVEFEITTE